MNSVTVKSYGFDHDLRARHLATADQTSKDTERTASPRGTRIIWECYQEIRTSNLAPKRDASCAAGV